MEREKPLQIACNPSNKVLRLTLLTSDEKIVSRGSGFVIYHCKTADREEGIYLYTCWHFLTGIDFFEPKVPVQPQLGAKLQIEGVNLVPNQESGYSEHGYYTKTIDIYDQNRKPVWEQSKALRKFPFIEETNVFVPYQLDVVRIPLKINDEKAYRWSINEKEIEYLWGYIGDNIFISGYPYGYSANGTKKMVPIFLKRAIATQGVGPVSVLLDGMGVPAMSGGPVFSRTGNSFKLVGIYRGVLYPQKNPDRHAALGLVTGIETAIKMIDHPKSATHVDNVLTDFLDNGDGYYSR